VRPKTGSRMPPSLATECCLGWPTDGTECCH
jgi:hypothetical protein